MDPFLSVIICTYNRQKFIGECLACLNTQTLPTEEWEAIIVDNNSSDNTNTRTLDKEATSYGQLSHVQERMDRQ